MFERAFNSTAEFGDEEGVFEAAFESLDAGIEERVNHCRNIFEQFRGRSDAS